MLAESVISTDLSIDAFAGSYLSMGVSTSQFNLGKAIGELTTRPVSAIPAAIAATES